MIQQDKYLDIRVRQRVRQLREILRLRLDLLDKDISKVKKCTARKAIDELSLTELNELRNEDSTIADKILEIVEKK